MRIFGRILLLAAFVVVAGLATRDAIAGAFARRAPALTLQVDPYHARALAAKLDSRVTKAGTPAQLTDADLASIRTALRRNPLVPELVRTLGVDPGLRGKDTDARALITLASSISRREVFSQLWLIEDAVHRNKIDEALVHYDVALSVSEPIQPLLVKVLTGALSERDIRNAVAPYLAAKRPWRGTFLSFAVANGKPREVAETLVVARVVDDPALRSLQTDLLSWFVARDDVAGAQQHALRMPGGNAARFATMGFTPETVDPVFQPLTWLLTNNSEIEAALDSDNRLQILASPSQQGAAAMRVMHLPAGRYDITQRVTFTGAQPAYAQWEAHCTGARADKFWDQSIPVRSGTATQRFSLAVPARCNGVRLILNIGAVEGQEGSSMTIDDLKVAPTGTSARD